jgi:hypothetical protein
MYVGIQSDDVLTTVQSVHYTIAVEGRPPIDATVPPTKLPLAEKLVATDPNARIDVTVEGMGTATRGPADVPLVTRLASTHFVAQQTKLLRVQLQANCLIQAPGGVGGPTCTAPQTCINGRCADDAVPPEALEPYSDKWPQDAPDFCKPATHGDPDVQLGTGQTDYLPITNGQTLSLEKGPQGGHHIWIAVRMKNLKQSGTTTTVTGVQPDTKVAVPPTGVVFTFDRDEGGYCKVFGITFRLDDPSDPFSFYKQFLGKPLDITVAVRDMSGATGTATAHIVVAPKLICPTGDTDPNCAT